MDRFHLVIHRLMIHMENQFPAAQVTASETVSAIQIRQDAAQACRLQNFFNQVDRAQAESEDESDDGAPVTSPPIMSPELPAFTRPTPATTYQLPLLSGWGCGLAQRPLSFVMPGFRLIVLMLTAGVDQSNACPGAHARTPTELEESTIEIIEMPSRLPSPEALTFASLLTQQTSSSTSSIMTSPTPSLMVLQSTAICRHTSIIVSNNSPFYSNVGYRVTEVLPTTAHLRNIAFIDCSAH